MSNITPLRPVATAAVSTARTEYLTFKVAGQAFAIPATSVQDVLRLPSLTPVPLARPEIIGLLNLRGHIVTAVSLGILLGCAPTSTGDRAGERAMAVVIEHRGQPACLVVDSVGDVLALAASDMESNPASMGTAWGTLSRGIFKMQDGLLVVLDVDVTLTFKQG